MVLASSLKELYAEVELDDKSYIPDAWQIRVLNHNGNIALRTGRQVGKSKTIAKKVGRLCTGYDNITILMIAAAQRQSSELFQKTLALLYRLNDKMIELAGGCRPNPKLSARQNEEIRRAFEFEHGLFDSPPTKTEVRLKNGTRIISLPTGKTGAYVRCYTVDVLIGDEAAYIPEPVWLAVRPMLATSKQMRGLGWEILLSTPFGKGGHYYNCCFDNDYLQIHISSENCSRISREFLEKEKRRLSKLEYAQEYLGEFVDDFNQFFRTDLIKKRMTIAGWSFKEDYSTQKTYALGVDIARYGEDDVAFVVSELDHNHLLRIVYIEVFNKTSIPDTVARIKLLDQSYHFRKIFIDSAGVGGGAYDLLRESLGKSKVVGIENATRGIDDERRKGILKEDLYSNALVLMERDNPVKIEIIAETPLMRSLRCMTYEYTSDKNIRIFGKDDHLAEAFVRACWVTKAKSLNLFIA